MTRRTTSERASEQTNKQTNKQTRRVFCERGAGKAGEVSRRCAARRKISKAASRDAAAAAASLARRDYLFGRAPPVHASRGQAARGAVATTTTTTTTTLKRKQINNNNKLAATPTATAAATATATPTPTTAQRPQRRWQARRGKLAAASARLKFSARGNLRALSAQSARRWLPAACKASRSSDWQTGALTDRQTDGRTDKQTNSPLPA